MKRMLRWRIRRCVASLLVLAMTFPLGEGLMARALAPAAQAAPSRQRTIVVFEFDNKSKEGGEGLARALTRQIRLAMEQSPAFDLVSFSTTRPYNATIERAIQDGQLLEQELAGVPDSTTAVKIARILGAETALVGEIDADGYEYDANQNRVALRVTAYLYNAATGEPTLTVTVNGEGKGEGLRGALEDRARMDVAKRLEEKLAGREPKEPRKPGARRKWLPWALGGVALAVLAISLLGGDDDGPSAPGAGVLVSATRDGVRLTWPRVQGAEAYRIYRAAVTDARAAGSYQQIIEVPATQAQQEQYEDKPPIVAGVRYAYQVAGVAGGKVGSRMNGDRAMGPGEPEPVRDVQVSRNLRSVQLTWPVATQEFVTAYRVYRSAQPNEGYERVTEVPASANTYTDSGLPGGATYFYKVAAVSETGLESNWQSMQPVAAQTDLRPSAPAGVTATAPEGERRIIVSWRANTEPDILHYQVYRSAQRSRAGAPAAYGNLWTKFPKGKIGRGGPWQLLPGADKIPANVTSVEDNSVDFNTTYYYVVRAVSAQGESPYSDEASATPNRRPGVVQNVTAKAGDGRVTITWGPLAEVDIAGYHVYRQVSEQPTTRTRLTDQPVTGLQYVDTQVTNDTTYQYFVTAIDTAGWEGQLSLPAEAMPTAPPEAPRNVLASAGNNLVTLVWDKNSESNLLEYRVYRSDSPNLTPQLHGRVPVTSVDPPSIVFQDKAAQNLVTYYYQVTAVNTSGVESARSPSGMPVSATPAIPPAAPTNVQAVGGDKSVVITWSPVTRLAPPDNRELSSVGHVLRSYRIYRTIVNTGVRTMVEDVPLANLQGQPRFEDRRAPAGVGLRYSVTATMLDSSNGILESEAGEQVDQTPVMVVRRLAPPANFTATGGATVEGLPQVTFNWTPSTDPSALGYVIYYSDQQAGPYTRVFAPADGTGKATVAATESSYILTQFVLPALENDKAFWFRIATVDKLGIEGTPSAEVRAVPNPVPPKPLNVTVTNRDGSGNLLDMGVQVSWSAPVGGAAPAITGYRVYRSKYATGPFELVTPVPVPASATPSFLDQFLNGSVSLPEAHDQDFYYRVVALVNYSVAGVVEGEVSDVAGPVRVMNVPPGKVTIRPATATNGIVLVRWDALRDLQNNPVRDLARYTVSRREKQDLTGETEQFFPVGPEMTEFYDTTATAGTTYVYRVQAVDFIHEGPWSDTVEVTP